TQNLIGGTARKSAASPVRYATDPLGCGPFVRWLRSSSGVGLAGTGRPATSSSPLASKQNDSQFSIPEFFNSLQRSRFLSKTSSPDFAFQVSLNCLLT
ncbi:MAG: hypothetical protein WD342_10440, partial [Verrucomicrobiales bacterium]